MLKFKKILKFFTKQNVNFLLSPTVDIEKTKFKIIGEIMHATGKYLQGLMRLAISKISFKSIKTIYYLTCLSIESSKIFVLLP